MKRETGYYWVIFTGDWEPAYFDGRDWSFIGGEDTINENDLIAIDENILIKN
jgi:hypothetical protein